MSQGSSALLGSATSMSPEMGTVAGSTDQSMSTQANPVQTGPSATAENLKSNMGLMQKFTNLLGKDPTEREKNAKIFAALVKDLGNVGKSLTDSTLMQRMMQEQSGGLAMLEGGQGGQPVGPISPTFNSAVSSPVMPSGGYR